MHYVEYVHSKKSSGKEYIVMTLKMLFYLQVHFFNSFFYDKLRTKGYEGVKRWTKNVSGHCPSLECLLLFQDLSTDFIVDVKMIEWGRRLLRRRQTPDGLRSVQITAA